jgi:hypothetical protein
MRAASGNCLSAETSAGELNLRQMIDTQPETENRSPGNRLLTVVALIIVSAIGLGFNLEWFHIGSESAGGRIA